MNKQNYPNFLIVGAAKSGTSSLHEYLNMHPDVYLPEKKELYFWQIRKNPNKSILDYYEGRREIPLGIRDYLSHFEAVGDAVAIGEACPSYLYYHNYTISSLKEIHPCPDSVKIIIILRDPVSRIKSQYRFVKKLSLDPSELGLRESLEREAARIEENKLLPDLFYKDVSNYANQVKAYKEAFQKVKIVLYDDLREDAQNLCYQLCEFLDVDPQKLPVLGNEIHNQAKTQARPRPALKTIHSLLKPAWDVFPEVRLKSYIRLKSFREQKIALSADDQSVIAELTAEYLPMLQSLEHVLDVDLTRWKSKYAGQE